MASYNRIILMGNLTRDPQLSYTPNNTAVCKFGLATNHRWKDREGNMRDETCFVDCTCFGRAAETFNQYMKKGRSAIVEGRLKLDQWTAPDGQKRSKHEVVVDNFQFVGGREDASGGGDTGGDGGARYEAPATNRAPVQAAASAGRGAPMGNSYDEPPPPSNDDIPF